MRDAATPPENDPDVQTRAAPTPEQHAANIRAAAAEVLARVDEWRRSASWHDSQANRWRFQLTVEAVTTLDALPEPDTHETIAPLTDAIRSILTAWRPSRPGGEQSIQVAVERLERATRKVVSQP
jgi:hypothetical protein